MIDIGMLNRLMMVAEMINMKAIMISMKAIMMILLTSRARKTRRKEREKMEIGSVMVVLCRLDTTPVCHTLKQILCSKLLSYE